MKISHTMDLNQLAEHMGDAATVDDALAMRAVLLEAFGDGHDTGDIRRGEWDRCLLDASIRGSIARQNSSI